MFLFFHFNIIPFQVTKQIVKELSKFLGVRSLKGKGACASARNRILNFEQQRNWPIILQSIWYHTKSCQLANQPLNQLLALSHFPFHFLKFYSLALLPFQVLQLSIHHEFVKQF